MNTAVSSNRIERWDNLKGLLIILVVIGHFIEPHVKQSDAFKSLFLFIYSFHMPLFFYVAGMFYSDKKTIHKVYFYLMMGFLCRLYFLALQLLFKGSAEVIFFKESGLPWFMYAMAAFTFLTWLLREINLKTVFVCALIAGCFSGFDKNIGDWFVLSRIIVYYPFYLLGIISQRSGFWKKEKFRPSWKLAGILVIALWVLACFNIDRLYNLRPYFTGRNPFQTMDMKGLCCRIFCYLITAAVSVGLILAVPKGKTILSYFGKRTLPIYFFHIGILRILSYLGCSLPASTIIQKIGILAAALLTAAFFSMDFWGEPFRFMKRKIYGS